MLLLLHVCQGQYALHADTWKLNIEFLNKLSPSIDVENIFFCVTLEKCNSVDAQPKRNALLKIVESQMKLATTCDYVFSKSAGGGHKEVKSFILSQFENEGMKWACSESKAEKMSKSLC